MYGHTGVQHTNPKNGPRTGDAILAMLERNQGNSQTAWINYEGFFLSKEPDERGAFPAGDLIPL